jgi:AraC-like DNA-binding protein
MKLDFFQSNRVRGERVIYTASSFARQNLIYLQEIGNSDYLQPYLGKRGELDSYLFFTVRSGKGELEIQDSKFEMQEGDCAFINCRTPYSISSGTYLWSLSWIHFNGPTMSTIYEKFLEHCGSPCFRSKDSTVFLGLHNSIMTLTSENSYVLDMQIMSKFSELLTNIMYDSWSDCTSQSDTTSLKRWIPVREYIDQNYLLGIKLDELSQKFAINKFYLIRKFKEVYGMTISQYITQKKITAAKESLRFSDFSITEIASRSGFNDNAYFTRVFKINTGVSPTQFKKEWHDSFKH